MVDMNYQEQNDLGDLANRLACGVCGGSSIRTGGADYIRVDDIAQVIRAFADVMRLVNDEVSRLETAKHIALECNNASRAFEASLMLEFIKRLKSTAQSKISKLGPL